MESNANMANGKGKVKEKFDDEARRNSRLENIVEDDGVVRPSVSQQSAEEPENKKDDTEANGKVQTVSVEDCESGNDDDEVTKVPDEEADSSDSSGIVDVNEPSTSTAQRRTRKVHFKRSVQVELHKYELCRRDKRPSLFIGEKVGAEKALLRKPEEKRYQMMAPRPFETVKEVIDEFKEQEDWIKKKDELPDLSEAEPFKRGCNDSCGVSGCSESCYCLANDLFCARKFGCKCDNRNCKNRKYTHYNLKIGERIKDHNAQWESISFAENSTLKSVSSSEVISTRRNQFDRDDSIDLEGEVAGTSAETDEIDEDDETSSTSIRKQGETDIDGSDDDDDSNEPIEMENDVTLVEKVESCSSKQAEDRDNAQLEDDVDGKMGHKDSVQTAQARVCVTDVSSGDDSEVVEKAPSVVELSDATIGIVKNVVDRIVDEVDAALVDQVKEVETAAVPLESHHNNAVAPDPSGMNESGNEEDERDTNVQGTSRVSKRKAVDPLQNEAKRFRASTSSPEEAFVEKSPRFRMMHYHQVALRSPLVELMEIDEANNEEGAGPVQPEVGSNGSNSSNDGIDNDNNDSGSSNGAETSLVKVNEKNSDESDAIPTGDEKSPGESMESDGTESPIEKNDNDAVIGDVVRKIVITVELDAGDVTQVAIDGNETDKTDGEAENLLNGSSQQDVEKNEEGAAKGMIEIIEKTETDGKVKSGIVEKTAQQITTIDGDQADRQNVEKEMEAKNIEMEGEPTVVQRIGNYGVWNVVRNNGAKDEDEQIVVNEGTETVEENDTTPLDDGAARDDDVGMDELSSILGGIRLKENGLDTRDVNVGRGRVVTAEVLDEERRRALVEPVVAVMVNEIENADTGDDLDQGNEAQEDANIANPEDREEVGAVDVVERDIGDIEGIEDDPPEVEVENIDNDENEDDDNAENEDDDNAENEDDADVNGRIDEGEEGDDRNDMDADANENDDDEDVGVIAGIIGRMVDDVVEDENANVIVLRRSTRMKRKPDWFSYEANWIPKRRKYSNLVPNPTPKQRRPRHVTPPPPPVVVVPRNPPHSIRNMPPIPPPPPMPPVILPNITLDVLEDEMEVLETRLSQFNYGLLGLELVLKLKRCRTTLTRLQKTVNVSDAELTKLRNAIGKIANLM